MDSLINLVFNYGRKRNNIRQMDFVERQVAEPDVYEPSELTKLLASARRIGH